VATSRHHRSSAAWRGNLEVAGADNEMFRILGYSNDAKRFADEPSSGQRNARQR